MKIASAILLLYSSLVFGQFHCDSIEGLQVFNRNFEALPESFSGKAKSCDSINGWIEVREYKNGIAISSTSIIPQGQGGLINETQENGKDVFTSMNVYDNESGKIVSKIITQKQGEKTSGQVKNYDPNSGKIIYETSSLNGKLDGIMRRWYSNGQLSHESFYQEGLEHGLSRSWSESGKLLFECRMKEGKFVDTCRMWNDDGMLAGEVISNAQGVMIRTQRWWVENGELKTEISDMPKTKKTKTETIQKGQTGAQVATGLTGPTGPTGSQGQIVKEKPQETREIHKDSVVFDFPDVEPSFPGGQKELEQYIFNSIDYPKDAVKLGLEDKIYISFIIEKNGTITQIRLERGEYQILINEAIRIVKSMPSWNPGKVNNEAVRTSFKLPIIFKL